MITYADQTLTTAIEMDRFELGGFCMSMGSAFISNTASVNGSDFDRGLQVKSVFTHVGTTPTPGNPAWRPPDW